MAVDRASIGFRSTPLGPFSLGAARDFAGGFAPGMGSATGRQGTGSLLVVFPIEGWRSSAAVDLYQEADGTIVGEVCGTDDLDGARTQALRCLSLDHDGRGWADVGVRDPVIGAAQDQYTLLRPVCFLSAWEAATSFVIGQRISMRQGATVKRWLAANAGDAIELTEGRTVHAFPSPAQLRALADVPGISAEKVRWLHGLAEAALDGALDTDLLRAMPEPAALAHLEALPGIGPWTATGVLMRGCGVADAVPLADGISRTAVTASYDFESEVTDAEWLRIADRWRPYRM